MLQAIKSLGRRYPVPHLLWGKLRWYSSPPGLRQIVKGLQHLGRTVQCPICGWRGNSFYPHEPPHYRPNAICPRCQSKERHRLLFFYLEQRAGLFGRSMRLLEIAPGPYSDRLFRVLPLAAHLTLDYVSPWADCHGDITALPLPARSFDLAICYHVLEHVPGDRAAMRELRRILRNGGLLLVQVPIDRDVTFEDLSITDPAARLQLFGQDDHVRAYGRDFVDRLKETGFIVQTDDFAAHLSDEMIRRHGLLRDELIYACNPNHEFEDGLISLASDLA